MGKEIVYCGDCGKSLREDDFTRGKAHHIDHRPYCIECKTPVAAAPSQIQTSSKLAAMKTTTGRHVVPPPTPSTRRHRLAEESSKTPLLVGAGLVGAAVVILVIFALSSGNRSSAPEELPPPPPPHAGPPKPAPKPPASTTDPDKGAAALKELEAIVAASAPPVAILQKCEEVRPLLQGTAHEARLKGIEDRARENRRVQQLDASLEEVKKLRALDPAYERKEEIVRLLNATLPLSGARRLEVEETLRSYQRDAQAYVPAVPVQPVAPPLLTPRPASSGEALGPYDTDPTGTVRHWLVLGPFKNRNDFQGLYDGDLLRTEAAHVPSAGLEVTTREGTKVRWTPVVAAGETLDLAQAVGAPSGVPAIFFVACWVDAETDLEPKFRMYADLGFMLYLDGKRFRNQPRGHKIGEEQDILRVKLAAGPHLLLFKIACPTGPGYLQLKLTQNGPEKMRGLRIWNQAPSSERVLYAQSFNEGTDGFLDGTVANGGVGGTKALLVKDAAYKERLFAGPVTAATTLRFKVKPVAGVNAIQVLLWSAATKQNYWYKIPNLPKGEWTPVEVKLAGARAGYNMDGASVEGVTPDNLRFHVEALNGVVGQALVDDLELLQ
jgi:hypothetical protein